MSVERATRSLGKFTQIDNDVLDDPRISFRAKGVIAHLLSKPGDWRTNYRYLMTVGPDGQAAVLAAMKELETFGYIVREKTQDRRKRWTTHVSVVETPSKLRGLPTPGSPTPGSPKPGRPTPLVNMDSKKENKTTDPPYPPPGGTTSKPRGLRVCDACREHGTVGVDMRRYQRRRLTLGDTKFGHVHVTCTLEDKASTEGWTR